MQNSRFFSREFRQKIKFCPFFFMMCNQTTSYAGKISVFSTEETKTPKFLGRVMTSNIEEFVVFYKIRDYKFDKLKIIIFPKLHFSAPRSSICLTRFFAFFGHLNFNAVLPTYSLHVSLNHGLSKQHILDWCSHKI